MLHSDGLSEILQSYNPWWQTGTFAIPGYPCRRSLQQVALEHVQEEPRRALLIRGPRQVGKTVLLLQVAEDLLRAGFPASRLLYFRFDDERLPAGVSLRTILSRFEPADETHPVVCLLDELTGAEEWSRGLKLAVDRGGYRVLATDSSARLLRLGRQESGVGRWDELEMETLTFREALTFQARPGETPESVLRRSSGVLYRFLRAGGFPEHLLSEDLRRVDERLRSDVSDRVIGRDLIGYDVARVQRLFAYLARTSGGLVSYAGLAGELEADQRSVKDWIGALIQSMLTFPLERLATRSSQSLRERRKLYVADPGLVCAFSTAPDPLASGEVLGRALETLVFRELRELCRREGGQLSFYRDAKGQEVDFVWDGPRGVALLEVGSRYRAEKAARLDSLRAKLKARVACQLHPGPLRDGPRSRTLEELFLAPDSLWEGAP